MENRTNLAHLFQILVPLKEVSQFAVHIYSSFSQISTIKHCKILKKKDTKSPIINWDAPGRRKML